MLHGEPVPESVLASPVASHDIHGKPLSLELVEQTAIDMRKRRRQLHILPNNHVRKLRNIEHIGKRGMAFLVKVRGMHGVLHGVLRGSGTQRH